MIIILPRKHSQAQVITWLFQDELPKKKNKKISQLLEIMNPFFLPLLLNPKTGHPM